MLALDQRRLHPELRGADRGDIAARTAADDDEIEILFGHDRASPRSDRDQPPSPAT